MARLSQTAVLLLLSSTMAFRISHQQVHKEDRHAPDLKLTHSQLRQTPDPTLDDSENAIPEDTVRSEDLRIRANLAHFDDNNKEDSEGKNQKDTEDNNHEDTEDSNQEDTEDNNHEDIEGKNQEDTEDNNHEDNEDSYQEDTEDSNHEDTEDRNQTVMEGTSQKHSEDKRKTLILSMSDQAAVRSNTSIYAFSAQLASNVQVTSGSTILFDNVRVNEGGLYFGNSGQFVCTDEGVYVFMWTLRHSDSHRGLGALALGVENVKLGPKTNFYSSSTYNGNSQMVAVVQCRLSPATAVIVRSMSSSAPTYMSVISSFSGFRLSPDAASAVAFTAELSKDLSLFPGGRIMFDNVVSNVGGHYNSLHHFFRCPDNGVYSFSVSTSYPNASNQWSVSRLMLDGAPVLQGPMTYRATTSRDSGSSSVTVLMQCQQGKDFYVESDKSYEFNHTEYGADLTSFSGFRLCSQCDDLVAFSAVLAQNVTTFDVDIPFESLLLTRGGAYNRMTGVFTCPDDALYMFQWSATSIFGDFFLNFFVNNSRNKQSYMTRQSSSDSYGTSGTSSQSTVIRCNRWDTVSLRINLRGSRISSSKILLAGYSTFSGYRLPGQ